MREEIEGVTCRWGLRGYVFPQILGGQPGVLPTSRRVSEPAFVEAEVSYAAKGVSMRCDAVVLKRLAVDAPRLALHATRQVARALQLNSRVWQLNGWLPGQWTSLDSALLVLRDDSDSDPHPQTPIANFIMASLSSPLSLYSIPVMWAISYLPKCV